MNRLALFAAFAGLMLSSVEPEAEREPLDRDPEPEPEPYRRHRDVSTPGLARIEDILLVVVRPVAVADEWRVV